MWDRSSVREFLAEEALFHLGVSTTRGLSLTVSSTQQVQRPWFKPDQNRPQITLNDPRIAHYSVDERKAIVREVNSQPNAMISENIAMACRVAPSFIRGKLVDWLLCLFDDFINNGQDFSDSQLLY
jgi:uncharacterized protein YdiU (UPF0061 family)